MTDTEILYGAKAIGKFLGITARQVGVHHRRGELPTFTLGVNVCARKATLIKAIEEKEKRKSSGDS